MRFLFNTFIATALLFGLLGLMLGQYQGHGRRMTDARQATTKLFLAKRPTASKSLLAYARWTLGEEPPSVKDAVLTPADREALDELTQAQAEALAALTPPFPLSLVQD